MKFTRNGLHFTNESEYNDWAIHETLLIINNIEYLYIAQKEHLENNSVIRLRRLVFEAMFNNNIKIKEKNIKAVMDQLKDDYKNESEN